MKVALVADVHLHPHTAFASVDESGLNTRSLEVLKALRIVGEHCLKEGIQEWWWLGDIFHVKGKLPAREFLELCKLCRYYSEKGIKIRIITGNHDYMDSASSRTILSCLPVEMVVTGEKDPITGKDYACLDIDEDNVQAVFTAWNSGMELPDKGTKRQLVLGHRAISGANTGPNEFVPLTGIPSFIFGKVDMLLLGHYHQRQNIDKNIWYVGSLLSHNFGETRHPGGFAVLDVAKLELEFIDIEAPRFRTFKAESLKAEIVKGESLEEYRNDYVRVDGVVDQSEENLIRRALERVEVKGLVFNYKGTLRAKNRLEVESKDTINIKEYIGGYVKEVAGKHMDNKKLVDMGEMIVGGEEKTNDAIDLV